MIRNPVLKRAFPMVLAPKQLEKIKKHCKIIGVPFKLDEITKTYQFWIDNLSTTAHYDRDERPINQIDTINNVLTNKAPDLLFVDTTKMEERIERFFKLGFINNTDKFYVFHEAPRGWYLQDWRQFILKFNYIQYRIMPWLLFKQDDQYPTPHPLIKVCSALELPYERIKSRFLWVSSAGISPPKLNEKGGDNLNLVVILKNLLLTNSKYFVKMATPGIHINEYEFFEKFISHNELVEDSIMSDITDLPDRDQNSYLEDHEDENIREAYKAKHKRFK